MGRGRDEKLVPIEVGVGVLDLQLVKTALSSPSSSLQSLPANNYIIERMGEKGTKHTY